ncbi:MAG: hypothetical protein ACI8QC_003637, partial [Planctomycetota bacterium]
MPARIRRLRWAIPAFSILFLLVAEGALRGRQYMRYGTVGSVHALATHEQTGLRIPIPHKQTARISIDSQGFRSPELELPKPAGRQRIAFLGGSTTFCAEATSGAASWPGQVFAGLDAQDPGRYDYLNVGVPGYTVESSQRSFESRVVPNAPDLVLIYHAYNDLVCDTRDLAEAEGFAKPEPAVDWLGERSLLWHLLRQNVFVRLRVQQVQAAAALECDFSVLAEAFGQRTEALVRAVQASGAEAVLLTFAYRGNAQLEEAQQADAAVSALRYMPYLRPEGVLAGIEAYNQALRDAAERTGAQLLECADAVPGTEQNFNDSVHLLDPGCRLLAERILGLLRER